MEFLSPGVFTQELKSDQQAVAGVSTSNFATIGWLPRGEENKAILIGSLPEYFRKFGGYWKNSDVPLGITAFFSNEGARAYVVRVCPEDALAAQGIVGSNLWVAKAASRGEWGNLSRLLISGNNNSYDSTTATYSRFDISVQEESELGLGDWETKEFFEDISLTDPEDAEFFPLVLNDEESGSDLMRITSVSGGIPSDFNSVSVSGESFGVGNGATSLTISGGLAQFPVAKFTVEVLVDGIPVARDDGKNKIKKIPGVSFTDVNGMINFSTGVTSITFTPAPATGESVTVKYYKKGLDSVAYQLSGGLDGTAVTRAEVTDPALSEDKKGIYALDTIDDLLNIGLFDFSGNEIVDLDLLSYCSNRKDCFAILSPARGIDPQDAVTYKRRTLASNSSYGAMYYPGIKVADPLKNGKLKTISPVGHIAGVYARTDNTRSVGKAPGGTTDGALNFAVALERVLSKADRDILYPNNINPLIDTPQTGRAVWGVRTLEQVGDFGLVNVRRLFNFLEKSLSNASQDLVFEPIGLGLFNTVKLRFDGFLGALTALGYFASLVPSESFLITVNFENNTTDTIAQRLLIVDVLVAPQTPGEFILLRFKRSLNVIS